MAHSYVVTTIAVKITPHGRKDNPLYGFKDTIPLFKKQLNWELGEG
jgi:hypothetical protein